jgi:hypothetical protein
MHAELRKQRKLTTSHVKSTYVAEWAEDGLDVALGQTDKEVGDIDLGGSHCLLPGGAILLSLRKGKKYKILNKRSARNNRHTQQKNHSRNEPRVIPERRQGRSLRENMQTNEQQKSKPHLRVLDDDRNAIDALARERQGAGHVLAFQQLDIRDPFRPPRYPA